MMNWIKRLLHRWKLQLGIDRRRFPRYEFVAPNDAHEFFSVPGISAYLQAPGQTVELPHPIINLSQSGISLFLLEGEDATRFKSQPKLTLKLYVESQLLMIPCEVVYVANGLRRMGLKFVQISAQQRELIAKFLDVHFLATSLKEIQVKNQRAWDQVCRWHHGMNNTDLFSWETSDGHFIKHLFIYVNHVVEWTLAEGAKTGRVHHHHSLAISYTALHSTEPNPISLDKEKDLKTIETAQKIIRLASIDPVLKKHFLDNVD